MVKAKLLGLVVLSILIFSNLAVAFSDSNGDGIISFGELFGGTQTQSIYSADNPNVQNICDTDLNAQELYQRIDKSAYCIRFKESFESACSPASLYNTQPIKYCKGSPNYGTTIIQPSTIPTTSILYSYSCSILNDNRHIALEKKNDISTNYGIVCQNQQICTGKTYTSSIKQSDTIIREAMCFTSTQPTTTNDYFYVCDIDSNIREKRNGAFTSRILSCPSNMFCAEQYEKLDATSIVPDSEIISKVCQTKEQIEITPIATQPTTQCYGPCPNIADEYKYINGQCQCVPKPITTTTTCTDSDNGKNYNIKGTITVNPPINEQTQYTDFCKVNGDLGEYFCTNNNYGADIITPLSGYICNDGKFQATSTPPPPPPSTSLKTDDIEVSIVEDTPFKGINSGETKTVSLTFKNKNTNIPFDGFVEVGIFTKSFMIEQNWLPDVFSTASTTITAPSLINDATLPCVPKESTFNKKYKLHLDANRLTQTKILEMSAPTYLSTFASGRYNWEGPNKNYLLYIHVFDTDKDNCEGSTTYGNIITKSIYVAGGKNIDTWTDCGNDGKDCDSNGIPYAKAGEQCLAIGPYCNTAKGYTCERPSISAGTICTKTQESVAKAAEAESKTTTTKTAEGVKITLKSTPFKLSEFQQSTSFEQMSAVCSYDYDCDNSYEDEDYPNLKYKVNCKKTAQITNILKQASQDQCDSSIYGKIQTGTIGLGAVACIGSTALIFTGIGGVATAYICGIAVASALATTGAAIVSGQCGIILSDTLPKGACIATKAAGQGITGGSISDSIDNFFSGLGDSFGDISTTYKILGIIVIVLIFLAWIGRK